MTAVRLTVEDVSVRFGNTIALDKVGFDLREGEVLALIGENGAGKSTLMKVLSGAVMPQSGRMTLNGMPYAPRDPQDARHKGVAMIYQELSLAPSLSVRDNIFLGMEVVRRGVLDYKAMNERAAAAIAELGHHIPLDALVRDISISDQQLVELARATAVGCNVLILDEPTSSITKQDVERLFELIRRLKSGGMSVIYISHFLEEVQQIADRFVVLRDGTSVGGGNLCDVSVEQIIAMMVGRELSDLYPRSERTPGDVVLQVGSIKARKGEVVGIFGLVGSGRTELFQEVFAANSWGQGVGLVSEDRKSEGLAVTRTITENLILSKPQNVERRGVLIPKLASAVTADWINRLRIKCSGPSQKVQELSGGNQQKIAIGRLLYHDVDVLLLDEPTRGIDVASKQQIYKLIDDLALQNKAIVIISSYLPELLGICDRIAVMARGNLGEPRVMADVDEHSIMLEATAVGASA